MDAQQLAGRLHAQLRLDSEQVQDHVSAPALTVDDEFRLDVNGVILQHTSQQCSFNTILIFFNMTNGGKSHGDI